MSHELRTPLNSILILGQQLAGKRRWKSDVKADQLAKNIHSAGTDLLALINDILDLSKIESGTVTVEAEEITLASLRDSVERMFHHLAESKNLAFRVEIDQALSSPITSDPKRLQQILKNLLSNACVHGAGPRHDPVTGATTGWSVEHPFLRFTRFIVAIEVTDTGIGIAPEKQKLIFEAFQQADAGTSRSLRRHRTGIGDQPGACDAARRRNQIGERPRRGQHVHALPADALRRPGSRGKGDDDDGFGSRRVDVGGGGIAGARRCCRSWLWTSPKKPSRTIDRRFRSGDNVLLIVDDDRHYSRILLGIARDAGFKGIVAHRGQTALQLVR